MSDKRQREPLHVRYAMKASQSGGADQRSQSDRPGSPSFGAMKLRTGGRSREVMLDVQFVNGNRMALSYGYLTRIQFDPSDGIKLEFTTGMITLRGRNLNDIYEQAMLHRLRWVRELDEMAATALDDGVPIITEIKIGRAPEEEDDE